MGEGSALPNWSAHDGNVPVAFIPATPLLLAGLNPRPTPEQLAFIDATTAATATLTECHRVLLIGSAGMGLRPDSAAPEAGLRRVPLPADGGATADGHATRPTSVLVGEQMLDRAAYRGPVAAFVAAGAPADVRPLATTASPDAHAVMPADEPWRLRPGDGVLVVGDGTATRHEKAPGHVVPGAVAMDDHIAVLLSSGDLDGLLDLDPALDQQFLLDGRAAWQAAAQLVAGSGRVVSSRLLGLFDPHHVAYFVAEWSVEVEA
ncbi:MAG: hypothetical protein ACH36H_05265 [Candidatus Nanopelagicales bacterium]